MRDALEKDQWVASHLRVRTWNYRGAQRLCAPESMHHALEVSWVTRGCVEYEIGKALTRVGPGQLMVVPAGVDHRTAFQPSTIAASLWLSADAVTELDARLGNHCRLEPGIAADAQALIALGGLLQQEAFCKDAGALMAADALAEALVLKVLRGQTRGAGPKIRSPGVRRAVDLIEARYAEPLNLDQLARTASMSRFHFSRSFLEQVGQSPYAYLQQVRLARAAELLRGRASVTEAALSAGFNDLGRFGRKFRERYGCTPSGFAARA